MTKQVLIAIGGITLCVLTLNQPVRSFSASRRYVGRILIGQEKQQPVVPESSCIPQTIRIGRILLADC